MKIAIFVHCFFPEHIYGTETYTLNLARELLCMGHEPVVISAKYQDETKNKEVITQYDFEGIKVYCIDKNYIPHTRLRETYYQPALRSLLKDILIRINPDIVHVTHLINHTAVLLEVIADLNIPAVATLTDFFGFCFNCKLEAADGSLCKGPNAHITNCLACFLRAKAQNPNSTFLDHLVGRHPWSSMAAVALNYINHIPGLRNMNFVRVVHDITQRPGILNACYSNYKAVIAPTNFLQDAYIANGLKVPVHLMRFGVDLPRFPKAKRVTKTPIRFGFIGQIAPHKGTDVLIDAFCRLKKGIAELRIYGPDTQDPQYMSKLKDKAKDSVVFFHGTFPKEQMADVFSELDFLVIPSMWYENSPYVLLNSLASHTPVIVSDVEGMTEFIEEGKNGYKFSRGNVNDLERVFNTIINDPEESRGMSRTTEYPRTTRMMVEDVITVYNTVLRGDSINYKLGCRLAIEGWVWLNRVGIFEDPSLRQYVSPFPPIDLMENVSGLKNERDFANHGADIFIALSEASPMPLTEYRSILDFGCGCGRLARMFKGHLNKIAGCDIDRRHVDWINNNLCYMTATLSSVTPPLPYSDNEFDAIISISIFTHLNEKSQDEFLSDLCRICKPGGYLFLTVHGESALRRAVNEKDIRDMISVEEVPFQNARKAFAQGKLAFILQHGHLTTVDKEHFSKNIKVIKYPFEYGITFTPETYIRTHWGRWFTIVDYRRGAIHQFQDIVVLSPKK